MAWPGIAKLRGLSCALLCAGCGLESGYEELGRGLADRGEPRLEVPGRRLVAGNFKESLLDWAGENDSGEPVLAVIDDSDTLRIVRPDSGACEVGRASALLGFRGGRAEQVASGKGRSVFSYFESFDQNARVGTLKFADPDCSPRAPELADAHVPLAFSDTSGFVVTSSTGELWAADPWAGEKTLWSDDLDGAILLGRDLWTLEGGVFVFRDLGTDQERRFGSSVREFSVAWTAAGPPAVYADETGVHAVDYDLEGEELLASDGCEPRVFGYRDDDLLTFLAPCEKRSLVVIDPWLDLRREYDVSVSSGPVTLLGPTGRRLYYVSGGEIGSDVGTLYRIQWTDGAGLPDDSPPVKLVENANLRFVSSQDEHQLVVVDWNGQTGRLVYVRDEDDVVELARDVAWTSWGTALVNFDGVAGDLVRVESDLTVTHVAGGVPLAGVGGGEYVLSNFDGETGTLLARTWNSSLGVWQSEVVASGVPIGGYRTLHSLEPLQGGFGYLESFDAASRTGRLKVLVQGETLDFGDGVAGFASTTYPFPGIIYRVRGGERAGIWYAVVN